MSGRFIKYLSQAASGGISADVLFTLMGYRMPGFLELILPLGLFIGIRSWLSGFKPARYFVLAYLAMAIPNMIGNLTNLGLLPPVTINLYLLGLIGTSLDAMLLAFAVANKFSLLHEDLDLRYRCQRVGAENERHRCAGVC